jgi:hypothetical protein|tara:strand:+ start:96 stop:227 length:132 start_codon:yes stop_codon:yes gene_type:complete
MMFVQQYTKGFSLLSQQGVGRGKKIKKSVRLRTYQKAKKKKKR